jgi:hypothetical protein
VEDSPCPVCGKVCPNESYCVNCGCVYDPVLKKYQTPKQIKAEKATHRKYQEIEAKKLEKLKKDQLKSQRRVMMVKIGREYKRQHGRAAEVGDIVRMKKLDGSYNKSSNWYIKTKHGWKSSPSKKRKPTTSQIKRVCLDSQKGR